MEDRSLITTNTIHKEYARTHAKNGDELQRLYKDCKLRAEHFPIEDLRLSLDDFSRKQGWM